MHHPGDALVGPVAEVDDGGHDHELEGPGDGTTLLGALVLILVLVPGTKHVPAVGAGAVVGDLGVGHLAFAALAPGHDPAHLRRRTRSLTGVGPMPNCSRSLRSTKRR